MKLPKDLLEKEKKKINGNLISHRKSQVKNKSPYKKNKIQDIGKWKSRILSYCMEKDLFKAKNEYYKLIESNPLYTYFLNEDIPLKQKKNFQLLLRKFRNPSLFHNIVGSEKTLKDKFIHIFTLTLLKSFHKRYEQNFFSLNSMEKSIIEERYTIIPPIYNTNFIKFCYILSKKITHFLLKSDIIAGSTIIYENIFKEINYLLESNYANFIKTIMLITRENIKKIIQTSLMEIMEIHQNYLVNPSKSMGCDDNNDLLGGIEEEYYQNEFEYEFVPIFELRYFDKQIEYNDSEEYFLESNNVALNEIYRDLHSFLEEKMIDKKNILLIMEDVEYFIYYIYIKLDIPFFISEEWGYEGLNFSGYMKDLLLKWGIKYNIFCSKKHHLHMIKSFKYLIESSKAYFEENELTEIFYTLNLVKTQIK